MSHDAPNVPKIQADFNDLFRGGTVLCLSHSNTRLDESGAPVQLRPGVAVTALDMDADEHGVRDDLIATGTVALTR